VKHYNSMALREAEAEKAVLRKRHTEH